MLPQLSQTLFRRRLVYAITLPIVLLLLLAGVSILQIARLLDALNWIDHTDRVISQSNYVQKLLLDMETGVRGYLLTGEPEFLEPYEQSSVITGFSFDELQRLVSDNASQSQRIEQIETEYEELSRLIGPAIVQRQQGEVELLSLLRLQKQKMDRLRQQISDFIAVEEQLRDQRSQRAQETAEAVVATSLILALAVGSILAYLIRRLVLGISSSYEEALQTARQETEATQRSAQRLAVLHDIDRSILAAESSSDLVRGALARLRQLVASQQALVALFDPSSQHAQILAGSAEAELYPPEGMVLPLEDCASGDELEHPQVRYIEDLTTSEQPLSLYEQLRSRGIRSCLSIPLMVQEKLIGELALAAAAPVAFDEEARIIVEEVAAQLAIALEQSKLRDQLQTYAAELEQRVEERTLQLQEMNQELEAFTYSVSHDLRAPLRTMQGFAQALLEDYGDQIDPLGQEYIQSIIKDSVQMETLISDLLAYSRLTRQEINPRPTQLTVVVQEAQQQLAAPIKESQAQITLSSELPVVYAHHSILVQVIVNLLSNAIKFVQPGTPPHIEIYAQEERQSQQDWVKLWVSDNGIGIAPRYQERIFQVFERLHGNERYAGTGIGLAIVRTGIERMGGSVGVESYLGQGSRFWIALPKAVTASRSSHGSNPEHSAH
ncbi:MAG: CHASE3 domain-containing protein [Cyanobacteria bacterium Co-bin8]|nr:CHASE3 domain-containing protein [Cyanobacteria bacterium Co-bin8]